MPPARAGATAHPRLQRATSSRTCAPRAASSRTRSRTRARSSKRPTSGSSSARGATSSSRSSSASRSARSLLASLIFLKWVFVALRPRRLRSLGMFEFSRALHRRPVAGSIWSRSWSIGVRPRAVGFFVEPLAALGRRVRGRRPRRSSGACRADGRARTAGRTVTCSATCSSPASSSSTCPFLDEPVPHPAAPGRRPMVGARVHHRRGRVRHRRVRGGLAFGQHPMAPRISPKKTWEGFAGAAVAALIAGVLLALFMLGLPWWTGLVFGAVDPRDGDRRRPRRVDDQARPRHQGHELVAARSRRSAGPPRLDPAVRRRLRSPCSTCSLLWRPDDDTSETPTITFPETPRRPRQGVREALRSTRSSLRAREAFEAERASR